MEYQRFQFVVEGMDPEQAEKLMDIIISYVESHGLFVGGGYSAATDADFPEASNGQEEQPEQV